MIFRKAEIKDIDDILDLLSQVLEIHAKLRPDIFISQTTKYNKDEIKDIINDPNRPIIVCEANEKVIAYSFCRIDEIKNNNMHYAKALFIDDLCVDEKYRHQGIGEKIYKNINELAKELECDYVYLSVWDGNEEAISFYNKIGFKIRSMVVEKVIDDE